MPTSQYPELFFNPEYLVVASCAPCNRHGAVTQAENRNNRMTIAYLEQVLEAQQEQIEELVAELARYRNGEAVDSERAPRQPQIY